MRRRQVLATGALTLALPVAGCLAGEGDEPNNPDDNGANNSGDGDTLIEADPESLLLTTNQVEAVDNRRWIDDGPLGESRQDRPMMLRHATVTRRMEPAQKNEDIPRRSIVLSAVWYHDDVDGARTEYEEHPSYDSYFEEEAEPQVSIAAESMGRIVDQHHTGDFPGSWLYVLFRDANVVGAVSYRKGVRPDEDELAEEGIPLAVEMHDAWRE